MSVFFQSSALATLRTSRASLRMPSGSRDAAWSVLRNDDPNDPMYVVQAVLPVGRRFHEQIELWERAQSLQVFPRTKLFMFRSVLTAALHLCYLVGIDKVLLAGIDLDTRTYFYHTDQYDPTLPYELRSDTELRAHFHNYSSIASSRSSSNP